MHKGFEELTVSNRVMDINTDHLTAEPPTLQMPLD